MENLKGYQEYNSYLNEEDSSSKYVKIQGGGPGSLDLGRMTPQEKIVWGKRIIQNGILLDGNLFSNGIDTVDINGEIFKKSVEALKIVLNKIEPGEKATITITGGASAVGSPGYDNKALAKRRSANYIIALNKALGEYANRIDIKEDFVVGKSTIKNSNEAKSEQFVKIKFNNKQEIPDLGYSQKSAIDNTSTGESIRSIGDLKPIQPKSGIKYNQMNLIIRFPEGTHDEAYIAIYDAIRKKGAYILKENK